MSRRTSLFLLPGLLLALGSAAAQAKAPKNEVWCVGAFEPGAKDRPYEVKRGAATVEAGGAVGKHHLCWRMKASRLATRLRIKLDADLSGYSKLSFHARADQPLAAGALQLNLQSMLGRYTAAMPAIGTEWKRFEIPLIAFSAQLFPDRRKISFLEFLERELTKPRVLHLDHVCFHRHPQGWRGEAPRCLDFEQPHHLSTVDATGSQARGVRDADTGGTALAWTLIKRRVAYVDFPLVPTDIRGEAAFAFRIRADRPVAAGRLVVRIYDRHNNYIRFGLKDISTKWISATVPLAYFTRSGSFDPTAVVFVEWIVWDAEPCTFFLDDLAWIAGDAGEASWRQGRDARVALARPASIHGLEADHSTVRIVARRRRPTLEWSVPAAQKWVCLTLSCLPEDVRSFAALQLRIRANRVVGPDEIYLRCCTTEGEYLEMRLPPLKKGKWTRLTLALADFRATRSVDPARIRTIEMLGWDLAPLELAVAEIQLTPGRRGDDSWRPTDKHLMARIFGAKRVSKVKRVKTKYFEVWTDSRAALGGFVRTLDDHVAFVCRELGMRPPGARIPVYLFRNAEGYRDYCVRCAGYTAEEAAGTAGHGGARYLAAYFTRPNSPVIVHELTHTLVCRAYGSWGGSWLHEGFAVYVESAFTSKDPVKEFSVHLRNQRHEPLAKFMTEESLAASGSRKESNRVGRLYDQAGAFFAFLKDGPHRDKYLELVKRLMKAPGDARDRVKVIEKLYGKSLAELEKEWVTWGTKRR